MYWLVTNSGFWRSTATVVLGLQPGFFAGWNFSSGEFKYVFWALRLPKLIKLQCNFSPDGWHFYLCPPLATSTWQNVCVRWLQTQNYVQTKSKRHNSEENTQFFLRWTKSDWKKNYWYTVNVSDSRLPDLCTSIRYMHRKSGTFTAKFTAFLPPFVSSRMITFLYLHFHSPSTRWIPIPLLYSNGGLGKY